MGINLSDADGFIIDGQTLARIKGHENYESKHLHQDEATADAGATKAGDYAANNHSWANWLNRLGGDYDSVSTDDWMKENGSNFELAFNNALYKLIDGSKTRNDGQSISVDTALMFDADIADPKRVVGQAVAQRAIAAGATGTGITKEDVDGIVRWSGLDFTPEELEELYKAAELMEIGAGIASPLKKVAAGVKVARNLFSKGKQDPKSESFEAWYNMGGKPAEVAALPKYIHDGQQGKHIVGHNNYKPSHSSLNSDVNTQDLLNGIHSGQYRAIGVDSKGNIIVDFGKPIGIDARSGLSTNLGKIHSGKVVHMLFLL